MHLDDWKCWIMIGLAYFVFSAKTYGQSAQLNLASGSTAAPGGTAALNLSLNAASSGPAGLQWTFSYSPTAITSLSVTPGPAAAAAGKSVTCASGSGSSSCLLTGSNRTTVSDGIVAVVNATLSPATTSTSISMSNPLGATADAAPIALTASSGTVTAGTGTSVGTNSPGGTGTSASTKYLSDLAWISMTNGWGPVEKDMSNGEQAAGDGRTISIRGVTYAKGLGAHANSNVQYNLAAAGSCTAFLADVGVDDETSGNGAVTFQVWADGLSLFDSGTVTGTMTARSITVDVTGKSLLTLIVKNSGDGIINDHADWANARLTCGGGTVSPPPPGTHYLSDMAWISMTNGWGPVEKDRSNGEQLAGDGRTISIRGVTYAKGLGAHANSNVQYNLAAAGSCTAFLADVGVDDETSSQGSVVFQAWVDGVKLFDSGVLTGTMAAKSVNIPIGGRSLLTLIINDAGDGSSSDHADWATARLTCQ